jgi:hypothetical protein
MLLMRMAESFFPPSISFHILTGEVQLELVMRGPSPPLDPGLFLSLTWPKTTTGARISKQVNNHFRFMLSSL